jgi:hypothetical protein
LNNNQTLAYKLSQALKTPVYSRAVQGGGLAQMYFQVLNDEFYNIVPPSDKVLYVFINDQLRRIFVNKFYPCSSTFILHYNYNPKNKTLVLNNYNNLFSNFIRSTFIHSMFEEYYYKYMISNNNYVEYITDVVLAYFVNSKKEMEKHWNNKIDFNVLFYEPNIDNFLPENLYDVLETKLKANGFNVIKATDLTDIYLWNDNSKYLKNSHPTEEAWDLLVPKIIETANL